MLKSELIKTLALFSEEEKQRFLDFLCSPYFQDGHNHPLTLRLVECIFENIHAASEDGLKRDHLYSLLYPEDPKVVRNKLEKQFSETMKSVRQFFRTEYVLRRFDEKWEPLAEVDFYRRKSDVDTTKRLFSRLDKITFDSTWGYDEQLLHLELHRCKQLFLSQIYRRNGDQNLLQLLSTLDQFALREKALRIFELFSLNRLTPFLEKTEQEALLKILENQPPSEYSKSIEFAMIQQALFIFSSEENQDDAFFDFTEKLHANQDKLNSDTLNQFEAFAINYCIKRYGESVFQPILYGLFKDRVASRRCYTSHGKIVASEYQSVVKVGLLEKDFDWVEQFIEENKERVEGSQDAVYYYQYNLACLHFEKGNFEAVLEQLAILNYNETMYKASLKVLEIKTLYELQSEVLDAKIEAAKVYFHRDKLLPEYQNKMFSNFVDFMRQLIHHSTAVSPDRIQKLKEKLEASTAYAEYFWLKEKIAELGK
jgi:hypothetical protein